MRLLLIIGGIVLTGVGLFGMSAGLFAFGSGFQEAINSAVEGPSAEDLCKPGETLVEESGQSEYTPGVRYYCEDSQGVRREVTGDFAQDLIGNISTGLIPSVNVRVEFLALIGGGLLLLLIGVFSGLRSKNVDVRPGVPVSDPFGGQAASWVGAQSQVQPSLAERIQQAGAASAIPTLADKLRELDLARGANLISEDEYQRLRQQILDSMT
jgi:hypothetical protein